MGLTALVLAKIIIAASLVTFSVESAVFVS